MKRLILLLLLCSPMFAAYTYRRPLTFSHTMVSGGNPLANFTVYVQLSGAAFKSAANGGKIRNSTTFNGQTVPADLVFGPNSDGSAPYAFDIESWDAVNGIVSAWVLSASLSNTTDWNFYAVYGNSAVTTFQGGAAGAAWNSSYKAVYHLNESASPYRDATSNGNSSTAGTYPVSTAGKIGNAQSFTAASSQYIAFPNGVTSGTSITMSGWIKTSALSASPIVVDNRGNAGYYGGALFYDNSTSNHAAWYLNNTSAGLQEGSINLNDGTWHYLVL